MSEEAIPSRQLDGDVTVGHDVAIGGDVTASGSIIADHDVTVAGWLDAPNLKGNVAISGNVSVGGNAEVAGSMVVDRNMTVEGLLRARNVDFPDESLSNTDDDSAGGVITFLKGILFGNGFHGIDADGVATLKSIFGDNWSISADGIAKLQAIFADKWSIDADGVATLTKLIIDKYGIDSAGNATVKTVTTDHMSNDLANAVNNRVLVGGQGYEMYIDSAGKSHVWVDELSVRCKAYFASLEIRKISYSGGTTIFSNAGSTLSRVINVTDAAGNVIAYKCYAKADDGTTKTMNWWHVGMQALCQTFNVGQGTSENKGSYSQRYYWRLVIGVGQETLSDNLTYDYVVLSNIKRIVSLEDFQTQIPTFEEEELGEGEDDTEAEGDDWTTLEWGDSGVLSLVAQKYTTWEALTGETSAIGYDDLTTDAPQPYDVIVQVGDQVNPKKFGNVIKLTTSTDDDAKGASQSEATAPSFDMYYAINSFSWSGHQTAHIAPSGVFFKTSYFKVYAGDDYTDASPLMQFVGLWRNDVTYYQNQLVSYGGQLWAWPSETPCAAGVEPSEANGWELVVEKGGSSSLSVTGSVIEYVLSDSGTTSPGDDAGWSTTVPELVGGKFLWTRITVSYSSGKPTVSYTVSYCGKDGEPVGIASTEVRYVVSEKNEQPSDAEFDAGYTEMPPVTLGAYLWTRTTIVYNDANKTTTKTYSVSRIGDDGDNGVGTHFAYATSVTFDANGNAIAVTGFSTTMFDGALYIGAYSDDKVEDSTDWRDYTWTRLRGVDGTPGVDGKTLYTWIMYADGNPADGYDIYETPTSDTRWIGIAYNKDTATKSTVYTNYTWSQMRGEDGANVCAQYSADGTSSWHSTFTDGDRYARFSYDDGQTWTDAFLIVGENGSNGAYTDFAYSVGTETSYGSAWYDEPPTLGEGEYLWMRMDSYDGDGNLLSTSYARLTGEKGEDGKGIAEIVITYQLSTSGSTTPTGSWSSIMPTPTDAKPWLWTKTCVQYTDGTSKEHYSVSYKGKDGASGADAVTYEIDALAEDAVVTISAAASGDNITYSGALNVNCKWNVYKKTGGTRSGSALTGVTFTYAYNNSASTSGLSATQSVANLLLTGSGISYSSTDGRTSIAVTFKYGGATIGTRIVPITLKPSSLVTATDDMWSSVVANKKSIAALQVEADSISAKVESITPASKNLLSMSGEGTRVATGMYQLCSYALTVEAGKTYTVTWKGRVQYSSVYMRFYYYNIDWSHAESSELYNNTTSAVHSFSFKPKADETVYIDGYYQTSSGGDPGTYPYKSYIDWVRVDEGDLTGNPPTEWEASDLDLEAVNLLPDHKTASSVYSTFTDGMGTRKLVNDNGDITSVMTVADDGDTGDKHIMFTRSSDPGSDNYDGLEWLMPFRGAGTYCLSADFYYHHNASVTDSSTNHIFLVLMIKDVNGTVTWLDSMSEGRDQYNWAYQYGWVSGYRTQTISDTYNGVEVSEIGVKVFMTRKGKMSVKNICVAKCGHATRYDAQDLSEMRKSEATQLATGFDIYQNKILVTTDQFVVRNNSGVVTAKINEDGVLETNGGVFNGEVNATSGTFNGTVKATNFFHNVFNNDDEQMAAVYKENSDGSVSVIAYVTQEEAMADYPNYSFDPCVGTADIIIVNSDRTVGLPRAKDFVGKVIEVYDVNYGATESGRVCVSICCNKSGTVGDDGVELFGMGVTGSGKNALGGLYSAYMTSCYMTGGLGSMARFVAMELPGYVGADYSKYWWVELTGNISNKG